jgi:hypothetical protein
LRSLQSSEGQGKAAKEVKHGTVHLEGEVTKFAFRSEARLFREITVQIACRRE